MKSVFRRAAIAALAFTVAGCFTDPKPLIDEFTFQSLDNQNFTESVSIAALFRDISFLGQVKTPSLCYGATVGLKVDGPDVTVTIDLSPTESATCNQQPGGVQYSGSVRNLNPGTYNVRIVQNVTGVGTTEFAQTVKL
jgi:hypothetical protein